MSQSTQSTQTAPRIERSEFEKRRSDLRAQIVAHDLDGVLVVSRGANGVDWGADVLYLANHYSAFPQVADAPGIWSGRGFSGMVMPAAEDGTLVVDIPDWRDDLVAIDDVRVELDMWSGFVRALRDRGLGSGRVGI